MKKKFIVLISAILFLTTTSAFSESWDDVTDLDHVWDGQKTITNKEFEQAIDTLQGKQKKREERRKKRKAKKISGGGTSLHNELNPDKKINEIGNILSKDEGMLVNVPVVLYIDGKPLEKGYYNVTAERSDSGKIYISFYQSQYFKGKVEAIETEEDFAEENVNFANLTEYNNSFVKIIYGSIDFNAYAYIPYSE